MPTHGGSLHDNELLRQYESERPIRVAFTDRLSALIRQLLEENAVEVHTIEARTKEAASVGEKLIRPGKHYSGGLADLKDLTGVRIITYYNDDIDRIGELIRAEFHVDEKNSDNKSAMLRVDEFGYRSDHYVIQLSSARALLPEWKRFAGFFAEVQVRTVLQHAWAAISHKLQYKRESDVPQALRRRLFRLSALLELGDDEFRFLRDETDSLVTRVKEDIRTHKAELDLNIHSIEQFVGASPDIKRLTAEAEEAGFDTENEFFGEEISPASDLLATSSMLNISTVDELSSILAATATWSRRYFAGLIAAAENDSGSSEWHVSPMFVATLALIAAKRESVKPESLVKLGWHEQIARRVLTTASEVAPS